MEGKPEEVTKKKFWKCTCEMFHYDMEQECFNCGEKKENGSCPTPVEVEIYLENLKKNKAILEHLVSIVNTCNNRYNEGLITAAEAIAAITLAAAYAETESF